MKSKGKIYTLSTTLLNESSLNSSNISKNVIFNYNKKEYYNKHQGRISNKRPKSRQNNSLEDLTKRFIKYAFEQGNETINLNMVMKKIKTNKRRIYDITNVLEGKVNIIF